MEFNDRRFYHGTHAELQPGDYIEPGHQPQHRMSEGNPYHDPKKVYVTPFPHVAAQYAWKKNDRTDEFEHGSIYEVEPEGRVMKDKEAVARRMPSNISYTAKRAKVVRRLDDKEVWG